MDIMLTIFTCYAYDHDFDAQQLMFSHDFMCFVRADIAKTF